MVGVPLKLGLSRQLLKGGIHVGRYLQDLMAIGLRVYGSRYRDRFQEGLPHSARVAALTAGISSVVERMTRVAGHSGALGSANPQNTEPLLNQGTQGVTPGADQVSSSSTAAMIQ
ncbi:hypothetical protein AAC387_Pa01g3785 [Persea americana]